MIPDKRKGRGYFAIGTRKSTSSIGVFDDFESKKNGFYQDSKTLGCICPKLSGSAGDGTRRQVSGYVEALGA
jgi:hypothetical protein